MPNYGPLRERIDSALASLVTLQGLQEAVASLERLVTQTRAQRMPGPKKKARRRPEDEENPVLRGFTPEAIERCRAWLEAEHHPPIPRPHQTSILIRHHLRVRFELEPAAVAASLPRPVAKVSPRDSALSSAGFYLKRTAGDDE